ncbi:MAG: hypothetical protein U0570_12110 [Phycisphaerales bacterium]
MNEPQARRLAGFLAEHGVGQLIVQTARGSRTLHARQTDLPAEIRALLASGGALAIPQWQARIEFTQGDVRFTAADPALQTAFLRTLAES